MKLKKLNVSSQLLIIGLAALVMSVMLQMAHAQNTGIQAQGQVLQTDMPQKTWGSRLLQNTTLNYYTQFLGPTVGGPGGQTYNVFVESNTPYQNFHAANIRYQFNPDWALGASLSAITAYGETTTSQRNDEFKGTQSAMQRDEFFNARIFLAVPEINTKAGKLSTTVAYEAPTSVIDRRNNMKYGGVLTQSFTLNLPSLKISSGVMWQYYRVFYEQNVVGPRTVTGIDGEPLYLASFARQTTIFNIGPFFNYRINDKFGLNSSVTFDWDQRGRQTGTGSWNNNLPNRTRAGLTYFPTKLKQLSSVGVFTQGLIQPTPETQALGVELAARF